MDKINKLTHDYLNYEAIVGSGNSDNFSHRVCEEKANYEKECNLDFYKHIYNSTEYGIKKACSEILSNAYAASYFDEEGNRVVTYDAIKGIVSGMGVNV